MRKTLVALGSAAALATGLTVGLPAAAHADGNCGYENFCAYSDDAAFLYQTPGNSGSWPSQVYNKVDWVMNNGNPNYAAHRVDIFYDTAAQGYGAYACIDYGTAWNLRGNGYHFTWAGYHGSDGQGANVHDNAVAHHWVSGGCGNYNDNF